jgi:pSer/pThr/pTyr-binding forkhead associated (FHA) protein
VKSWLLSTLRAQYAAKGADAFVQAAPRHWLLWEPGAWRPPQKQTMAISIDSLRASSQAGAEALVIALEPAGRPLVLGRAPDCDVVINDGTLSARHVALHGEPGGWQVEDLGSTNGSRVNEVTLKPGQRLALPPGARLDVGQVALTFYASEGLWPRLSKG